MSDPVPNDRWNDDARAAVGELCAWLARHEPVDARERESIDEFIAVAPGLQAPFDEHADPTHVTASCIVVGTRGVVLHEHKRLGLWLQPGGHVERGETLPEATLREAREETGLDVAHPATGPLLIHLDVHPGPRGHRHFDLRWLVHAPDDDPQPAPGESPNARWFGWDEAEAIADAGLLGGLRAARRILGV